MRIEEERKEEIQRLLNQFESKLLPERLEGIRSLVTAGEEVVAIEILIDNLDDLAISTRLRR